MSANKVVRRALFAAAAMGLVASSFSSRFANAAVDVTTLSIVKNVVRFNGIGPAAWTFDVTIQGSGINDASIQNLTSSNNYGLTNMGGGKWEFTKSFASQAALDAEFQDSVNYKALFNQSSGTPDSVASLTYTANKPASFATITNPTDGSTGVPLSPLYAWNSTAAITNNNALSLFVFNNSGGTVYSDFPDVNTSLVSWQPGALSANTQYTLFVGVNGLTGGAQSTKSTTNGDSFIYIPDYDNGNEISFTTGTPEPGTLALAGIAPLALLLKRRRVA